MSIRILAEVDQYAPWAVKGSTLVVLMKVADAAGDDFRMMWESAITLARRSHMTERNFYNCMRTLDELNILETPEESEWPPAARLYRSVVRRIRPVSDWIGKPEESTFVVGMSTPVSVVDMQTLHVNSEPQVAATLTGSPENFSYYEVPIVISNGEMEETTSLPPRPGAVVTTFPDDASEDAEHPRPKSRRGWDAVQPLRRGGRKQSRKELAEEAAAAEREQDPAYVVAQTLAEDDPSAPLPAPEESSGPTLRRSRATRSKRPSERLAEFFEREARNAGHEVPGWSNRAALTGTFGRWMADGTEYNTIRDMVSVYWETSWQRSDAAPAWKDFLAQRGLLTKRIAKEAAVTAMEASRTDPSQWTAAPKDDPSRYEGWGTPAASERAAGDAW